MTDPGTADKLRALAKVVIATCDSRATITLDADVVEELANVLGDARTIIHRITISAAGFNVRKRAQGWVDRLDALAEKIP